jgi:RND family efflux transporter MFP subunit
MKYRYVIFTAVFAMALSGVWLVYGAKAESENEKHAVFTAVRVAEVSLQDVQLPIKTSGRLAPKTEITLSFKIGGVVQKLFTDEGRRVKKGQLLARLDQSEINAEVARARSAAQKALRDLTRAEALFADSVATLEQVQDARTGVEVANAQLRIAEFNSSHAQIVAPANGRIQKRFSETNEIVAPGQRIFQFASSDRAWIVRVNVIDRDVVRLRLGDTARITFDTFPDKTYDGTVTEIAESADAMTGTFEVEVQINDADERLRSGFFARVHLLPAQTEKLTVLPIESLYSANGDDGYVFAYNPKTESVQRVPVQIARLLDRDMAVTGLPDSVRHVVTDGALYLQTGSRVQIKK